ncbi:hypothetical protein VPH35_082979 [Triticum aestivum]
MLAESRSDAGATAACSRSSPTRGSWGPERVFDELTKALKDPADFVDFDLPSALKEWKLGYYIPIKRNVYLTKKRVEDDGIFCSCSLSSGSPVACGKDCQCGMLFSCCSSNCKCENDCANKSFQLRPLFKTKLIKTEKCGFGLIAEDEIKKGEFVIEYVGEVIDDRTCEERLWKMKRQRYTNFYLCEVSSNMVIDATNKGNKSRFINHSCEPNTEMQKWTVDGETRVGIFALRDIEKGEELTYDYKFVQFGADQDCHCGSSNCRKMVGTSKSVNSFVLHNGNSASSQDQHDMKKRKTTSDNCIGEIIRLWDRRDKMYAFTASNLVDGVRYPFICRFQFPVWFNPLSFNILPFRYVPAVVHDYDEYTGMHTVSILTDDFYMISNEQFIYYLFWFSYCLMKKLLKILI